LTASLYSNKDLSYVMTENELTNGIEYNPWEPNPDIVKSEEKITLKDEKTHFTKGKLNATGATTT
jgi:hypothetical protein